MSLVTDPQTGLTYNPITYAMPCRFCGYETSYWARSCGRAMCRKQNWRQDALMDPNSGGEEPGGSK